MILYAVDTVDEAEYRIAEQLNKQISVITGDYIALCYSFLTYFCVKMLVCMYTYSV